MVEHLFYVVNLMGGDNDCSLFVHATAYSAAEL